MENREFKFRAWHLVENRWIDLNGFNICWKLFANKGEVYSVTEQGAVHELEVNYVDIMQATGLEDNAGKDVYRGDILESCTDSQLLRWEVIFKAGCFGIRNIGIDGYVNHAEFFHIDSEYYFKDRRIIGNIHEQKHLQKDPAVEGCDASAAE